MESGIADDAVGDRRNAEPSKDETHHIATGDTSCLRSKYERKSGVWRVESEKWKVELRMVKMA